MKTVVVSIEFEFIAMLFSIILTKSITFYLPQKNLINQPNFLYKYLQNEIIRNGRKKSLDDFA